MQIVGLCEVASANRVAIGCTRVHPVVHLVEGDDDEGTASGGGVDHVAFRCSDLAPMIERLRSRGIDFKLTRVPSLDEQQLLIRDPLGIGVEFIMTGVARC